MAAGFTADASRLPELRRFLAERVAEERQEAAHRAGAASGWPC